MIFPKGLRTLQLVLVMMSISSCFFYSDRVSYAEPPDQESSPDNPELQSLLEKSLSVVEIDNELKRVGARQNDLTLKMEQTKKQITEQQQAVQQQQAQAGRVLRGYYTGEQTTWMTAMLSLSSFKNLLSTLDYVDFLFHHNRQTLKDYAQRYQKLLKLQNNEQAEEKEMQDITSSLLKQRERLSSLQSEVDGQINGSANEQQLRLLIEELGNLWNTSGVFEMKYYFKALSQAMNKLPSWIQDHPEYLQSKGLSYIITLPDHTLNDFLISQNEIFKHFSFSFNDGQVVAAGKDGALSIQVTGHYSIINSPKNGLMFHIDHLQFNGVELPDTTRAQMEKEFDLGFYPGEFMSFLKAEAIEIKEGTMKISLSLTF